MKHYKRTAVALAALLSVTFVSANESGEQQKVEDSGKRAIMQMMQKKEQSIKVSYGLLDQLKARTLTKEQRTQIQAILREYNAKIQATMKTFKETIKADPKADLTNLTNELVSNVKAMYEALKPFIKENQLKGYQNFVDAQVKRASKELEFLRKKMNKETRKMMKKDAENK